MKTVIDRISPNKEKVSNDQNKHTIWHIDIAIENDHRNNDLSH